MKRFFPLVAILVFVTGGLVAWEKTRFFIAEPLHTPTAARFSKVFPKNTREIFENSDSFYFYSLNPSSGSSSKNKFHQWEIMGRALIKDKKTQQEIIAHYYDGVADTHSSAACFEPRHGIRTVKANYTFDLIICFGCSQSRALLNNEDLGFHHVGSKVQPVFDAILTQHKVPLPAQRNDK